MELIFLGTGAGMPSKQRNVTSIALELLAERGSYWLFDCGEATQHQILHASVKLSKTEKLFVTHLHGDHIYGIPGLLTSRGYQGGNTPFTVYGPKGIAEFIRSTLSLSKSHLDYPLNIVELGDEGLLFEDRTFKVEAAKLEHRIECWGYRVIEKASPGTLQHDKLKELGVPSGPMYGRLKAGERIQLESGVTLNGIDYIGPEIPGRTVVILGDTKKCAGAVKLAEQADVLVHEATFDRSKQDLADAFDHSTAADAAETAHSAGVGALLMTHISSRYQAEDTHILLDEARAIHANAHVVYDGFTFPIERKAAKAK
jgi:ribonuclease Z